MRSRKATLVVIAVSVSLIAGGCRAYRYACRGGLACETDVHCRDDCEEDGEGGYCVNSRCTECRINAHCDDDYRCVGGECMGPPARETLTNDDFQEPTGVTEPSEPSEPSP